MYEQLLKNNLNLYFGGHFQSIPIQLNTEHHIEEYLAGTYNTIFDALDEYPNTCVVRVDLKIPKLYKSLNDTLILRFFEFLQTMINANLKLREDEGYPFALCNIRYVASRSRNRFLTEQYNILLFFNLEAYNCIGDYARNVGGNMAERIRIAWADALESETEYVTKANLVNVPKKPVYHINYVKGNSYTYWHEVKEIFHRFSYFTTTAGKNFSQGFSPFLYSGN